MYNNYKEFLETVDGLILALAQNEVSKNDPNIKKQLKKLFAERVIFKQKINKQLNGMITNGTLKSVYRDFKQMVLEGKK